MVNNLLIAEIDAVLSSHALRCVCDTCSSEITSIGVVRVAANLSRYGPTCSIHC